MAQAVGGYWWDWHFLPDTNACGTLLALERALMIFESLRHALPAHLPGSTL